MTPKKCEYSFSSLMRQLPMAPSDVCTWQCHKAGAGFDLPTPIPGGDKQIDSEPCPVPIQVREEKPIGNPSHQNILNCIKLYLSRYAEILKSSLPKKINNKFKTNTNHFDLPVVPWTVKGPSPLEQADVHNIYTQKI